jgi:hypothetical protein
MRRINSFFIIIALISYACNGNKDNNLSKATSSCMPGFILIVYIGENSAPVFSTLIRTDETDSTYFKNYIGDTHEMFLKNDFSMDEYWDKNCIKKFIINDRDFNTLKKYIISNNTRRDSIENVDDYSFKCPIKIILSDKCDSVEYIVNRTDSTYFKRLIAITEEFGDKKFNKQLVYYKELQEFNYEGLRKKNN